MEKRIRKIIIGVSGIIMGALVVGFLLPHSQERLGTRNAPNEKIQYKDSRGNSLGNAFLPPRSSPSLYPNQPSQEKNTLPQSYSLSTEDFFLNTIRNLSNLTGSTTTATPPKKETLALPLVAISEFPVENDGAADVKNYMTQVAANSSRVSFTKKEFDQLLKRPNRRILRPHELIETALKENSFGKIQNSLHVLLDGYAKQDALLKNIKVSEQGITIAQKIIGMERLTVTLMKNAIQVNAGTMAEKEFRDFYERYKNTSLAVTEDLALETSRSGEGLLSEKRETKIARLFHFVFGRLSSALAQSFGSLPFGGDIEEVSSDNCYCSGEAVTLSENYVQGGATDFLYPYSVIFSGTYSNWHRAHLSCIKIDRRGECVL